MSWVSNLNLSTDDSLPFDRSLRSGLVVWAHRLALALGLGCVVLVFAAVAYGLTVWPLYTGLVLTWALSISLVVAVTRPGAVVLAHLRRRKRRDAAGVPDHEALVPDDEDDNELVAH